MARARNIKPQFFSNDELGELDPLCRLFFIGLWTVADFKGCVEYRPKKLKIELLPYDDCDIEKIVTNLDQSRFITIYTLQERYYIKINNFRKHQNPHPNERKKGSEIPDIDAEGSQVVDFKELVSNHDKNVTNREDSISDRADSCFLIPDPLNPSDKSSGAPEEKPKPSKFKFSYDHQCLAQKMAEPVQARFPAQKINIDEWADAVRKLNELDGHMLTDIRSLWEWITNHERGSFSWADNCRTPMKLREKKDGLPYFNVINTQRLRELQAGGQPHATYQRNRKPSLAEQSWQESEEILADIERREARERAMAENATTVRPQVDEPGGASET